jgi:hypothetical protein
MAFCANETQIVKSFIYNIKESKVGEFCATYFSEFDPKYDKSKYQILRELGIKKSSAYLILKKDLNFHPYHPITIHHLNEDDPEARIEF